MQTVVKSRKWGNSVGIAIPNEIVERERIKPGEELVVDIRRKRDVNELQKLFGSVRFKKSAQEIKDELRRGWK